MINLISNICLSRSSQKSWSSVNSHSALFSKYLLRMPLTLWAMLGSQMSQWVTGLKKKKKKIPSLDFLPPQRACSSKNPVEEKPKTAFCRSSGTRINMHEAERWSQVFLLSVEAWRWLSQQSYLLLGKQLPHKGVTGHCECIRRGAALTVSWGVVFRLGSESLAQARTPSTCHEFSASSCLSTWKTKSTHLAKCPSVLKTLQWKSVCSMNVRIKSHTPENGNAKDRNQRAESNLYNFTSRVHS